MGRFCFRLSPVCTGLLSVLLAVFSSACTHSVTRYALAEDSLRTGDARRAAQVIEQAEREYGSESRVLYGMDRGLMLHLAGEYEASNAVLSEAEDEVDRLYTRRIGAETKAFLTNDSKLPYEGEPYEQTMLNVVKALNYAAMGNWTEALVEARRLDHRLNVLTDRTGPKDGYRDDPFARYLSGLLYETAGDLNNAFVAYRKAYELYGQTAVWSRVPAPPMLKADLLRITDALHLDEEHQAYRRDFGEVPWRSYSETRDLAQVLLITFNGRSPRKEDRYIDVPISLDALNLVLISKAYGNHHQSPERRAAESVLYGLNGRIIRVAIPALVPEKSTVVFAELTATGPDGHVAARTQLVQDLTALADRSLSDRLPAIAVKAVARSVVKYSVAEGMGYGARAAAGKDAGPLVGLLVGALAKSLAVASEQADTRSWRTLPDEIQIARAWLPPGRYELRTRFLDRAGRSVGRESAHTVSLQGGDTTLICERVLP
ncbi:COG3014 family protein [Candidatus Nitrospira bockiana]